MKNRMIEFLVPSMTPNGSRPWNIGGNKGYSRNDKRDARRDAVQ